MNKTNLILTDDILLRDPVDQIDCGSSNEIDPTYND